MITTLERESLFVLDQRSPAHTERDCSPSSGLLAEDSALGQDTPFTFCSLSVLLSSSVSTPPF